MNKKLIASILTGISLGLGSVITQPIEANSPQRKFACVSVKGVPTTVFNSGTSQTKQISMIRWSKNDNAFGDIWTPQRRCQEVSAKFQEYYDQGKLEYITHGIKNGYPIVCVASFEGGSCTGQLFTLRKGDNAQEKVEQLFNANKVSDDDAVLNESIPAYISKHNDQVYIDINSYLNNAEASVNTQTVENNNNTTATEDDCWFCN